MGELDVEQQFALLRQRHRIRGQGIAEQNANAALVFQTLVYFLYHLRGV